MTIQDAIAKAAALTGLGDNVGATEAVRWLSEYDGKLAREFFKVCEWSEYDAESDQDKTLLIPHPWDGLYIHLLEAMAYYSTGEYQRSENARAQEAQKSAEFKAWIMRTYGRPRPCVLEHIIEDGG